MPDFVSCAQNGEDVVLWRALGKVSAGRYVEVGAYHPSHDSVTRAFYDRGWNGITIEPVPYFADLQRTERPRDRLVQAAITNTGLDEVTLHVVPGTGLSTIIEKVIDRHTGMGIDHVDLVVPAMSLDNVLDDSGWAGEEIHFMLIDVEGAEHDVLQSVDLKRWRPWVLVVESTEPNSIVTTHDDWESELLAFGYEFCLFDGLSRFYVATERSDRLRAALSYPACVLDDYHRLSDAVAVQERQDLVDQSAELREQTAKLGERLSEQIKESREQTARLRAESAAQLSQTVHWRTVALTHWADAVNHRIGLDADRNAELVGARAQLRAMQRTVSWRLTRPLRGVRRVVGRARRQ